MAPYTKPRSTRRGAKRQADKLNDKAWKAVREFNTMIPTFTTFSRMITGRRDIVVRAGSGVSRTDGKIIFIVPPIALGEDRTHVRHLCDQRGEDRRKLCPACAAREYILRRLYHEIAHIAFKSVERPTAKTIARVVAMIREWHPPGVCSHAVKMENTALHAAGHQELVNSFSPYLTGILRSVEDARVDSKMYSARRGLRVMFESSLHDTFTRGVEMRDGSRKLWRETPLGAQVTIGMLLVAVGHTVEEHYLCDEAREILQDAALMTILGQTTSAMSAGESVEITIQAFRRLNEMGLFLIEKCQPIPSMSNPPEDKDKDSDGNSSDCNSSAGSPAEEGKPDPGGEPGKSEDQQSDGDGKSEPQDKQDFGGDFENDDASGSGEDQKEAESEPKSNQAEVRPGDDVEDSTDSDDTSSDHEDGGRHGDGAGSKPEEQESGNEDEELDPAGSGGTEPLQSEDEADEEPADSDNKAGGSDGQTSEDESDAEPGAEDQDPSDRGGSAGADRDSPEGDDAEAESKLENGPDGSNPDGVNDDLGEGSDDGEGNLVDDSPELKGEDVWSEDNEEGEGHDYERGSRLEIGDPDEMAELLEQFTGHDGGDEADLAALGEKPTTIAQQIAIEEAIEKAVEQSAVFDTSSRNLSGLRVFKYPHAPFRWDGRFNWKPEHFMPAERIIGSSLMKARLVFNENARGKMLNNLKSGRIDARVLGRRAPVQDPRLFHRKQLPGKRDYFVLIGIDCSGSNITGDRMERVKRAVFAKAELLSRLGVKFAIYAHTGGKDSNNIYHWDYNADDQVWMLEIKSPEDPWSSQVKERLAQLYPIAENFDGHSLEFYRKTAEKRTETDRIIIYYTDGDMPAANFDEELPILQTEIQICKKKSITLMAVGINTSSPTRYGFDTVRVDSDEDLPKVIDHIKRRLTQ